MEGKQQWYKSYDPALSRPLIGGRQANVVPIYVFLTFHRTKAKLCGMSYIVHSLRSVVGPQ